MSTVCATLALVIGLGPAPIVPSERAVGSATAIEPRSGAAIESTGLPTIESDALTVAKRIHARGRVAFDLADYDGAIARWSEVYELLPSGWQRTRMLYNIADTHVRAYAIDGDPARLRRARLLFARFLDEVRAVDVGRESLSDDFTDASAQITEIDERLAAIDADEREERRLLELIARSTFDPPISPTTRRLRGVGVGLCVGAAIGATLMGAGLGLGARLDEEVGDPSLSEAQRADRIARGRRANVVAGVGAGLAVVLAGVGVPLTIVGVRRAHAERREAEARLLPTLTRGGAGIGWRVRF